MDFDKLKALLDLFAKGEVSRPNMLAQIKLHADERVAAEREACQKVCRSMSFEFNAGSREQDVLQRAATRLDMPEFRA